MRRRSQALLGAGALAVGGLLAWVLLPDAAEPEFSAAALEGKALFEANCATCHGEAAAGTDRGPPLVHPIYEPGHHGDAAFLRAVMQGSPAHHWGFGDMPPVPGLTEAEVGSIVAYVRTLQRAAGIE